MINLLPTDIKSDITYARKNTMLRRWIISCFFALAGVGLIVAGGHLYMQKSIRQYTTQVQESRESLKAQKMEETQKRVEEISANTKLAAQVLSREILFSKLIRQIGSALPADTALNSLQIDKVQGGIQLNAEALDFTSGTQIQVNLQDPKNGVFQKADINSIDCVERTPERPLPCSVSLRALFGESTDFKYKSSGTGVTP